MMEFETPQSIVKYDEKEGILYMLTKPGSEHDLAEVQLKFAKSRVLVGAGRVPVLLDTEGTADYSPEVRGYMAGPEASELVKALAVVVYNIGLRIAGNFFIHVTKPPYPTKLFSNREDARAWLGQFVEKKSMA